MKKKKIKDSSECVIPTFYVFFCPQGPNIFIPKKSHNDIAFQFRKSQATEILRRRTAWQGLEMQNT